MFNNAVERNGVLTTGEQCQSKWKKLEQKYKEVKFHNNQSGNDLKVWEFYELMENVMGDSPNILMENVMGNSRTLFQSAQ